MLKNKKVLSLIIASFCIGLFCGPVAAEEKDVVIPLTLEDLTGKSKIELSMPMLPGDNYFGLPILLGAQLGMGNYSLGIQLPMAYFKPDGEGASSEFVLGSPTIDFKLHMCKRGQWAMCYGFGVAISAGFLDTDGAEFAAHTMGMLGHQDPIFHMPEALGLRPLVFFAITNGELFAQAEFGSAMYFPIIDTDGKDTLEAGILYQFAVGYTLMEIVTPMIELRGVSPVTEDGQDTRFWMNFGARGHFGLFQPFFRLGIPLTDQAKMNADVHIEIGGAIVF
jgi:hypothetical protein